MLTRKLWLLPFLLVGMLAFGQPASAQLAIAPNVVLSSLLDDRIAVVTGPSITQDILCGIEVYLAPVVAIDNDGNPPILTIFAFFRIENAPEPGTRFNVFGRVGTCVDESNVFHPIFSLEEIGPEGPPD